MDNQNTLLVRARATAILGEYNHSIEFDSDSKYVIIYGPNGVGKTKFLEIIDSIGNLDGLKLTRIPFKSATLEYSDGTELTASRAVSTDNEPDDIPQTAIRIKLKREGHNDIHWSYYDELVEHLRKGRRYEHVRDDLWRDRYDEEILHIDEIRLRNISRSRPFRPFESDRQADSGVPTQLVEFTETVPSFLIETQRLWSDDLERRSKNPRGFATRDQTNRRSKIREQAETIRELLNQAQTKHSRITQQLDRTFPTRVLSGARTRKQLDPDLIRRNYDKQNDFRSRLARVASVSLPDELALPDGKLEPWAKVLLDLYINDATQKLEPFVGILEKIELLESTINSRLLNKRLEVTDQEGLTVIHTQTGQKIDLENLSSGEQHEIILMIDLLFNVPQGGLVLIDEPEISLHVAWQLSFMPDVEKIADLVGFRFVVATHSPQIINDQWKRAVRLGPEKATF